MAKNNDAAVPDRAALHSAALRHLARYAATEAGLIRVLDRRIARWLHASGAPPESAASAYQAARTVARELVAAGLIDDAAFAEMRARRLARSGRSRVIVASHLAAKGVAPDIAGTVLPADDFPAALMFLRKRRFGPFRRRRPIRPCCNASWPRWRAPASRVRSPNGRCTPSATRPVNQLLAFKQG